MRRISAILAAALIAVGSVAATAPADARPGGGGAAFRGGGGGAGFGGSRGGARFTGGGAHYAGAASFGGSRRYYRRYPPVARSYGPSRYARGDRGYRNGYYNGRYYRGGYYRGYGYYGGRGYYYNDDYDDAWIVGAGLIGLGAGVALGAAAYPYGSQYYDQPRVVYDQPAAYGGSHAARCSAHYRSYNPRTDTFVTYSGAVRRCTL